jgi:hypothetical protein
MSPRTQDIDALYKKLSGLSKKRADSARKSKGQRRVAFIVFQGLLFFSYIYGFSFIASIIKKEFDIKAFSSLLWFVSMFLSALVWRSSSLEAPSGKKELDEWIWKQGKRNFTYYFVAFILFAINQGLPISIFGDNRFFAILGYIGVAVYCGCVLLVLWRPELFTSGLVGGVGSSANLFFVGFLPSRLALLANPNSNVLFALLFIPLVLPYFGFLYRKYKQNDGLNIVQISVLQIIHPERLFVALRQQSQIIHDQYQAFLIKKQFEKELPLGIKTELVKLYASEHKSSSEGFWWLAGATAFAIFILDVLAQLIVQDVFYAPYIKPFLCKILVCG